LTLARRGFSHVWRLHSLSPCRAAPRSRVGLGRGYVSGWWVGGWWDGEGEGGGALVTWRRHLWAMPPLRTTTHSINGNMTSLQLFTLAYKRHFIHCGVFACATKQNVTTYCMAPSALQTNTTSSSLTSPCVRRTAVTAARDLLARNAFVSLLASSTTFSARTTCYARVLQYVRIKDTLSLASLWAERRLGPTETPCLAWSCSQIIEQMPLVQVSYHEVVASYGVYLKIVPSSYQQIIAKSASRSRTQQNKMSPRIAWHHQHYKLMPRPHH
jgi:hypothetical protein